jgi:ribonuclease BN (tRNA processing enzyme)
MRPSLNFLGVGGFFSVKLGQSNVVFTGSSGRKLLIDAGVDLKLLLNDAKVSPETFSAVYISHLHGDHCGGLDWFALYSLFVSRQRPTLFVASPILSTLREWFAATTAIMGEGILALESYFDVVAVEPRSEFEFDGSRFQVIPVPHISPKLPVGTHSAPMPEDQVPEIIRSCPRDAYNVPRLLSYALCIRPAYNLPPSTHRSLFFSADCNRAAGTAAEVASLDAAYADADIVFHDCSEVPNPAHTSLQQLQELPEDTRSKIFLYHTSDERLPESTIQSMGFAGYVPRRVEFEL